jgi:hypothetical protein
MMAFLKGLFGSKKTEKEEKNDFSGFFLDIKSKDKAKIIRQVLREATEEQREIMKEYEKKVKTT